jgi:uncharacterized protein YqeY
LINDAIDPAHAMKARLRADLRSALKKGRTAEVKIIRALVAAIDNAEAPPLRPGQRASDQHRFRDKTAEVDRLSLSAAALRSVLSAEVRERESAAAEMVRLNRPDRADALRAEALLAKRYIE